MPDGPAQTTVMLSCGHRGAAWGTPAVGGWVSCWAVVITAGGTMHDACQTQRRITAITTEGIQATACGHCGCDPYDIRTFGRHGGADCRDSNCPAGCGAVRDSDTQP
jgi:hypothetical protein